MDVRIELNPTAQSFSPKSLYAFETYIVTYTVSHCQNTGLIVAVAYKHMHCTQNSVLLAGRVGSTPSCGAIVVA
jgi:hypothetical protein